MKTIKGVLVIVTILTLSILVTDKTSAISSEEIYTKVLVNNVENCYKYALKSSKIGFSDYISFDSLMNDGFKQGVSDARKIYIPAINDSYNRIENTGSNGGRVASCYEVFMGNSSGTGTDGFMEGLFKLNGKTSIPGPINKSDLTNFMSDTMKYSVETEQDASGEEYCYSVYVKESTTAAQKVLLGSACANKDNYPLSSVNGINFTGGQDNTGYTLVGGVKYVSNAAGTGWHDEFSVTVTKDGCTYQGNGYSGVQKCSVTKDFGLNEPDVGDIELPTSLWPNRPEITIEITKQTSGTGGSEKVSFIKDNNKWQDFVTGLTGKNYDDFVVSEADKYDFYLQYLKNNFGQDGTSIASSTCQADKPAVLANVATDEYYIYIKNSGWCLANLDSYKVKQSHAMTVFSTGNNRTLGMVINTAEDLVKLMGELDYSDTSMFTDIDAAGTADQTADNNGVTEEDTCGTGAAGSLGWIVCPILEWMQQASESMYDDFVRPALETPSGLFKEGGSLTDSGTYQVWQIFQGFANIIFVILLLVVIVSQVTGIGIDNYGIKRILPKLIVAAVLVNLSYIICVIAVDLSNIVGVGAQELFNGIGAGISLPAIEGNGVQAASMTGVAILAAIVAGTAIWANPAILLTLLVSAIGVVVSVLFVFLILSLRQAALVVLVVVAPVAIVFYTLPNTKKIFDRWLKLGGALLLVFPICGLLIGGGNFVSKLLLSVSGGNIYSAFIAMAAGIAPIFLIPMVLRNSLSGLGNIGARISGFGQQLGRRAGALADNGIRNTERFKTGQAELARRRQERSAQRTVDRLRRRGGGDNFNANNLNNADRRRMARSQEVLRKMGREDAAAGTALTELEFENNTEPELQAAWNEAFDTGDVERLEALTNVLNSRYGTHAAGVFGSDLEGKDVANNEDMQRSMRTLRDILNNNSSFANNMKNKASDAFAMISSAGMVYDETTHQNRFENLGHFSGRGNPASDLKDWSTQSAASLQRAINSGALTNETIQQLLTSEDSAIRSGIQSDAGKRDVLQAQLHRSQHPMGAAMGPAPDNRVAAQLYRREQQGMQDQNELFVRHEQDAERIGKTSIELTPANILTGAPAVTFEGYATPAGFNAGGAAPVQNADGHYIYTDATNGRQWNATTGRYMPQQNNGPNNP